MVQMYEERNNVYSIKKKKNHFYKIYLIIYLSIQYNISHTLHRYVWNCIYRIYLVKFVHFISWKPIFSFGKITKYILKFDIVIFWKFWSMLLFYFFKFNNHNNLFIQTVGRIVAMVITFQFSLKTCEQFEWNFFAHKQFEYPGTLDKAVTVSHYTFGIGHFYSININTIWCDHLQNYRPKPSF